MLPFVNSSIFNSRLKVLLILFILSATLFIQTVHSIRCYQCSSDEEKLNGTCATYQPFDLNNNSPVDCSGEDAKNPGTFCYKSIQQSPIGYLWDGRWRTVIRRCAQVSDRGISWGCDWGYDMKGVYWEECYCAEDGCNSSEGSKSLFNLVFFSICQAILGISFFRNMIFFN